MEHETEQLDRRPLILKRFIWDIFPHDIDTVREAQSKLGLVPDGDDPLPDGRTIMEVEHSASDTRINRTTPLSNALELLSGYAAEVIGHYLIAIVEAHAEDEVEVPEDFYEGFARQNHQVIYDASFAIIAHLLDTGVLAYGPKVRKEDGE